MENPFAGDSTSPDQVFLLLTRLHEGSALYGECSGFTLNYLRDQKWADLSTATGWGDNAQVSLTLEGTVAYLDQKQLREDVPGVDLPLWPR